MPIAVALVAGGLATLNPCGFVLLPAMLSFYLGSDEDRLPKAPTRAVQGLLVGLLITAGFLLVFAVVGIPISVGATQITRAIPISGIVLGVLMVAMGLLTLSGRQPSFGIRHPFTTGRDRRHRTMLMFGVTYGIASLGCTLPVFLALIGASLTVEGPVAGLLVLGAYGLGMGSVMMALAVGAALLRDGLAQRLRRLLPYMNRIAGTLLALVGIYLTYYWARVRFAPIGTLAEDPLVATVQRFTTLVQRWANAGSGNWLVLVALGVVVTVAASAWWKAKEGKGSSACREDTEGKDNEPRLSRRW